MFTAFPASAPEMQVLGTNTRHQSQKISGISMSVLNISTLGSSNSLMIGMWCLALGIKTLSERCTAQSYSHGKIITLYPHSPTPPMLTIDSEP